METIAMLGAFGLTSQEAKVYIALHGCDFATGYELAKVAGISRSNAYAALSGLVDKGAAVLIEGKPVQYRAVAAEEFCANSIRRMQKMKKELQERLVLVDESESQYVTIKGNRNITAKIETILEHVKQRVYIAMPSRQLALFTPAIESLTARNCKVVIVSDQNANVQGATVYHGETDADGLRIIADSTVCLTGDLDESNDCTCLYSCKKNLASLIKHSIKNEITLISLSHNHTGGTHLP